MYPHVKLTRRGIGCRGEVVHRHIGPPFDRRLVAVDGPARGAVVARQFACAVAAPPAGEFGQYVATRVNARPDPITRCDPITWALWLPALVR